MSASPRDEPRTIMVRDATPEDIDALAGHIRRMAAESEGKALDPDVVDRGLRRALSDPEGTGRYLVAEAGHAEVVASLMISKEWSDWRAAWYWWIQSVYVEPDRRGQGIYEQMYAHVKELARQTGEVHAIRLYVEKDNTRAQRVYERNGMHRDDYLVYEQVLDAS